MKILFLFLYFNIILTSVPEFKFSKDTDKGDRCVKLCENHSCAILFGSGLIHSEACKTCLASHTCNTAAQDFKMCRSFCDKYSCKEIEDMKLNSKHCYECEESFPCSNATGAKTPCEFKKTCRVFRDIFSRLLNL